MKSRYSLLNDGKLNRFSFKPLIFGIVVGIIFSHVFLLEDENDARMSIYEGINRRHDEMENGFINVTLRCIIVIQPSTLKAEKFITSIRDTYSKSCDEALFFTSDKKLESQFANDINIYHFEGNLDQRWYSTVHKIFTFVEKDKPVKNNTWTVLLNEQNYLVAENLVKFLTKLPSEKSVICGNLIDVTPFMNYIFPVQTELFQIDAGLVLSAQAIREVNTNEVCSPSNWNMPSYTGKALFKCAQMLQFELWDPVDDEEKRLFLAKSPRDLFAQSNIASQEKSYNDAQRSSPGCCSDQAIIFGSVNYRDQRVLDYALKRVKVFGL
uniref:Uncharacterized protein n=1 Tax=Panagrolaimus sp. JU765 TaxID=591449 RepID=A0AC34Q6F4_9BILA